MTLPLVSVIIRSYNQEEYIATTIQSAVDQDYENLQIVVVDDNSTDNTANIIREFERKYPGRVEAHIGDKNLGEAENLQRGFNLCKGDFITILDGDDIYHLKKIAAQVKYLLEMRIVLFAIMIWMCLTLLQIFHYLIGQRVLENEAEHQKQSPGTDLFFFLVQP
ncbi:MAG: glycosyltransferase family 2 protein [Anaerolineaceae bacterium]|nr:glycosyltransferase family 2 protein [Anaerolineaceae bacterium]